MDDADAAATPSAARHLNVAVRAVSEVLPTLLELVDPALTLTTSPASANLVRQLGTTARLAGSTGAVQSVETGRFIGQLHFAQVSQLGALGVSATMAFQLAGALAMQQALNEINESLKSIEGKVDEILRNQRDELVLGLAAQEDLLAQVIATLAAGGNADPALLARLRDIEATLQPLALRLVRQVERQLQELDEIGAGMQRLVALAEAAPTRDTPADASARTRVKDLARFGTNRTADLAKRSFGTGRSKQLRKRLTEAGDEITWTEEVLAAALRALSARALAGLLANALDTSQPATAAASEADAIRAQLDELQARLEAAAGIRWTHDLDDGVRARLFVGQGTEEALVAALSPRVRGLESHVVKLASALHELGRCDMITYELTAATQPPPHNAGPLQ